MHNAPNGTLAPTYGDRRHAPSPYVTGTSGDPMTSEIVAPRSDRESPPQIQSRFTTHEYPGTKEKIVHHLASSKSFPIGTPRDFTASPSLAHATVGFMRLVLSFPIFSPSRVVIFSFMLVASHHLFIALLTAFISLGLRIMTVVSSANWHIVRPRRRVRMDRSSRWDPSLVVVSCPETCLRHLLIISPK